MGQACDLRRIVTDEQGRTAGKQLKLDELVDQRRGLDIERRRRLVEQ
jgi:hypothetical protein